MSDPIPPTPAAVVAPAASPTGLAMLSQKLIKIAVPVFGVIALIAGLPEIGVVLPYPWFATVIAIAKALLGLGVVLGIASQGARKAEVATAVAAGATAATADSAAAAAAGNK